MDKDAEQIIHRLQKEGFKAYFVGGCVRDTLAGFKPKDFDIVTDARPGQIRRRIPFSYTIGRRFRLVLVRKKEKQFEVSTLRRLPTPEEMENKTQTTQSSSQQRNLQQGSNQQNNSNQHHSHPRRKPSPKLFYGNPEQDTQRRDFTINALYYDPIHSELLDYCQGYKDIKEGYVRMIGKPFERLSEDPVRILRALRLAHKLHFTIETELRQHLPIHAHLLKGIPLARKREEYLKIFRLKQPLACLYEAYDLNLLPHTLPYLQKLLDKNKEREQFHHYISHFSSSCQLSQNAHSPSSNPPEKNSIQLLAPFLLALVRTCAESNPKKELQLNKEKALLEFMSKEMGIHRNEGIPILSAIEMQYTLNHIQNFKKKNLSKREAFTQHIYFPLALWLASLEQVLAPEELLFWQLQ